MNFSSFARVKNQTRSLSLQQVAILPAEFLSSIPEVFLGLIRSKKTKKRVMINSMHEGAWCTCFDIYVYML